MEGRGALANNLAAFKWAVIFGVFQTTLMFSSYFYGADLSQGEYIVQDIFTYFASTMCIVYTLPSTRLRGNPPTGRIFGPKSLASMLGPLIISWVSLTVAIVYLKQEPWFSPHPIGFIAKYDLPETTTFWIVSLFFFPACYISMAFGGPWRQPLYKNWPLLIVIAISLLSIVLFVGQFNGLLPFLNVMEVVTLPTQFRIKLAVIGVITFFAVIIWERFFVVGPVGNFLHKWTRKGRAPEQSSGWCNWGFDDGDDAVDDYFLWPTNKVERL